MPDDAHLRFRLRESLKVDFHNRNSRVRSHYWYHFQHFKFYKISVSYFFRPDFRKIPGLEPRYRIKKLNFFGEIKFEMNQYGINYIMLLSFRN